MIQIGYSELTKRFYFLPIKGSKVDITNDIKEIIDAHIRLLKTEVTTLKGELKGLKKYCEELESKNTDWNT